MEKIKEYDEQLKQGFPHFIKRLRERIGGPSTAILFGSRARGTASFTSDFDVLVITSSNIDARQLRLWAVEFNVDLFVIPVHRVLDLIDCFHTVLLDALTEGQVLYDNLDLVSKLRERSRDVIDHRQLVRTSVGWMRRKTGRK